MVNPQLLIASVSVVCLASLSFGAVPLTIRGPDGVEYPYFGGAGVPGGIPDVPVKANVRDFGGVPDDGKDDTAAIQRAADYVGGQGGGAVLIPAGAYHLDGIVIITHSNVVLRGEGPDRTKLFVRYTVPADGLRIVPVNNPGLTELCGLQQFDVHCPPSLESTVELFLGDQRYRCGKPGETPTFRHFATVDLRRAGPGEHKLRAVATYADGRKIEGETTVRVRALRPNEPAPTFVSGYLGAITFLGTHHIGDRILLAQDGNRGDLSLVLQSAAGIKPGDAIRLTAPRTERWDKLTGNVCQWGTYRQIHLRVEAVEGNTVVINQPLRIDFPTADGAYVEMQRPICRCGVENLWITHENNLWWSSIIFSSAWECWARNVHVIKTGRFMVYPIYAKWCEVRDCYFEDAWNKGGGGTAYAGFEQAQDCLLTGCRVKNVRHGPQVQWGANGCVLRDSVFENSDGQFHSGYCHENLFELNRIIAGGYGHGFWASPPSDRQHGPTGPRNVIYNNMITAQRDGIWLGGVGDGWIVQYNSFDVGGNGITVANNSSGHLIANNLFRLRNPDRPVLSIADPRSTGIILRNNIASGAKTWVAGKAQAEARDNVIVAPDSPDARPPSAPAASLFDWQRQER